MNEWMEVRRSKLPYQHSCSSSTRCKCFGIVSYNRSHASLQCKHKVDFLWSYLVKMVQKFLDIRICAWMYRCAEFISPSKFSWILLLTHLSFISPFIPPSFPLHSPFISPSFSASQSYCSCNTIPYSLTISLTLTSCPLPYDSTPWFADIYIAYCWSLHL
jgi:hypothetical protein